MAMKFPPHPGLSVRYNCMEPMGLGVTEAAERLKVSEKRVSSLINCRSGITRELADRLHEIFGGGAETWYRLQVAYDRALARNRIEHYRDRTRPWRSVRRAWRKRSEAANKALGKRATGLHKPERIEREEGLDSFVSVLSPFTSDDCGPFRSASFQISSFRFAVNHPK